MQHAAPAQFALTSANSTFSEWFSSYLAIRASLGLSARRRGELLWAAGENYDLGCSDRDAAEADKTQVDMPLCWG